MSDKEGVLILTKPTKERLNDLFIKHFDVADARNLDHICLKLVELKSTMNEIYSTLKPTTEPIWKLSVYRINHSYQKTFGDVSENCKVFNINELAKGLPNGELEFIGYGNTKLIGIKQKSDILLDNNCAFEFTLSQTDRIHPLITRLSLVLVQLKSYFNNKKEQLNQKLECIDQLDFLD